MFKNAGGKIMLLAKFNTIVWIIVGILVGVSFSYSVFMIISIVSGIVLGWYSSILLYAFGELCQNINTLTNGDGYSGGSLKSRSYSSNPIVNANIGWKCPKCGIQNMNENKYCSKCLYIKE